MAIEDLRGELLAAGAGVVGFGDVSAAVSGDIAHLRRAVCIGVPVRLHERALGRLRGLQRRAAAALRAAGHRFLVIPPDSDRSGGSFVSRLYPLFSHKTAVTCSGLGWVGRSGLVINPEHGPRVSWATVLTDAPLPVDPPVREERCGGCRLCVEHCPSGALTGRRWSLAEPFVDLVDRRRCRSHKAARRAVDERPNCGLCITVCPWGRGDRRPDPTTRHAEDQEPA